MPKVNVTPATATIAPGSQVQFTAAGTRSYAWSSSNPAVATVTSTGLVTGVANGTATIMARSGKFSGSASLTVAAPAPPPPPPPPPPDPPATGRGPTDAITCS